MTVKPWVPLQDVAKHLPVAEDSAHRWGAKQGLLAFRAGRVWRFKLTEVDKWLRSGQGNDPSGIIRDDKP